MVIVLLKGKRAESWAGVRDLELSETIVSITYPEAVMAKIYILVSLFCS